MNQQVVSGYLTLEGEREERGECFHYAALLRPILSMAVAGGIGSPIFALSLSLCTTTNSSSFETPPSLSSFLYISTDKRRRALPYCIFPRGKMAIGPGTIKFGEREREEKEDGRNWASIRGTLFY